MKLKILLKERTRNDSSGIVQHQRLVIRKLLQNARFGSQEWIGAFPFSEETRYHSEQ